MLILNDYLNVNGGSLTLILRICEWAKLNRIEVIVLTPSVQHNSETERIKELGIEIIETDSRKIACLKKVLDGLQERKDICFVSFLLDLFCTVEVYKYLYKCEFRNILYVIHQDALKKARSIKLRLIKERIKAFNYKLIKKGVNNKSIFFIDKISSDDTENFYGKSLGNVDYLFLPMHCKERADSETIIRKGYECKTILTASRADFPFKGYILGLIDDFVTLKQIFDGIKLKIFSGGKDFNQITNKINSVPMNIQKDITLSNWIPYGELKKEIENCYVFDGMGTSVVDAALSYKIVIPAKLDSYKHCASQMFCDSPEYFHSPRDCNDLALSLLKKVFSFSYDEYRDLCYKHFFSAKELYDEKINLRKLCFGKTITDKSIMRLPAVIYYLCKNWFYCVKDRLMSMH